MKLLNEVILFLVILSYSISGEKPYKCHICDVKVTRQEHLKRHLLTHIEGRPYKCSACDFTARRKDGVRSHQRSKHQGIVVSIDTIIKIPGMTGADGKHIECFPDTSVITGKLGTIPFGPKPNKGKKKKKKKNKDDSPPVPVAMVPGMPLPGADMATITSMTALLAQQKQLLEQQAQQQAQIQAHQQQVEHLQQLQQLTTTATTTVSNIDVHHNTLITPLPHSSTISAPQQNLLQHSSQTKESEIKPLPVILDAAHKSMMSSMPHKLSNSRSVKSSNVSTTPNIIIPSAITTACSEIKSEPYFSDNQIAKHLAAFTQNISMPQPLAKPDRSTLYKTSPLKISNGTPPVATVAETCVISDDKLFSVQSPQSYVQRVASSSSESRQHHLNTSSRVASSAISSESRQHHLNTSSPSMVSSFYGNWPNLTTHHPQPSLIHAPNPIHSGGAIMGQMINSLQEHMPQHPFGFGGLPTVTLPPKTHHT